MSVIQDPALPATIDERGRLQAAWNQLNLVLGFFSRIDAKLSVVLGINLGMLALAGSRMPAIHTMDWRMLLIAASFAAAIAASFYHLWKGAFPDLNGGTSSIVYFKSIAGMSESAFRHAYSAACPAALANDVLNQVWRNSKILDRKFTSLRRAFVATICAVAPWVVLLIALPASSTKL
ncbi:MAG: hypothetical protein ABS45_15985 [Comamonas sp. SCN 65-56]|uniref:Pycsar system effector family protein n=1 Tax=Comamonas sp. SCN 65-56 TaxID=1660095 RepID=UPI0008688A72|nr:Pycsar system effector family protein [Comamonas sp. SCN 65-56]ODS90376.1 MAG: hypothetical protein ABS45_15985 [Comamonas sp. SCN 65-56]